MKRTALSALVLVLAVSTAAATPPSQPDNLSPANTLGSDFQPFQVEQEHPTGLSWFSSQRFTMSHSLSYGVYSGSQGTESLGLWSSRLSYRLSNPLQLSAEVGVAMDPAQEQALSADSVFLKSLDLEYRPSKNFQMRLMYQGAPPGGYPGWNAGRYYDRDPFDRRIP